MNFKHVLAGAMMAGVSTLTFAAGNPLSVHVLNLENGLPGHRH